MSLLEKPLLMATRSTAGTTTKTMGDKNPSSSEDKTHPERTLAPLRFRNKMSIANTRRAHHRECHPLAVAIGFLVLVASLFVTVSIVHGASKHPYPEAELENVVLPLPCLPFSPLAVISTYGLSVLLAGSACLVSCCAGQFGCFALQAGMLDLAIVFPLNVTLWALFRVLTPLRYLWRHLLCWFIIPFASIFHMRPRFFKADLKKFVLAVPFAFRDVGMGNIYDAPESKVREEMRALMQKIFPRITERFVPDAILCNTLFRLMLGFAMFPLAWWLCDEMYCVPMSSLETTTKQHQDNKVSIDLEQNSSLDEEEEDEDDIQDSPTLDKHGSKDLDVTFVFPKCRFLMEAREVYGDRAQGNKVCRRVCRLLIEELTGQTLGHQWKVKPNLRTMRCTFTITTAPFDPPHREENDAGGGCGCSDPRLEW